MPALIHQDFVIGRCLSRHDHLSSRHRCHLDHSSSLLRAITMLPFTSFSASSRRSVPSISSIRLIRFHVTLTGALHRFPTDVFLIYSTCHLRTPSPTRTIASIRASSPNRSVLPCLVDRPARSAGFQQRDVSLAQVIHHPCSYSTSPSTPFDNHLVQFSIKSVWPFPSSKLQHADLLPLFMMVGNPAFPPMYGYPDLLADGGDPKWTPVPSPASPISTVDDSPPSPNAPPPVLSVDIDSAVPQPNAPGTPILSIATPPISPPALPVNSHSSPEVFPIPSVTNNFNGETDSIHSPLSPTWGNDNNAPISPASSVSIHFNIPFIPPVYTSFDDYTLAWKADPQTDLAWRTWRSWYSSLHLAFRARLEVEDTAISNLWGARDRIIADYVYRFPSDPSPPTASTFCPSATRPLPIITSGTVFRFHRRTGDWKSSSVVSGPPVCVRSSSACFFVA